MQTKTELKGVKERNYIRQWLGGSILALAIFMFGFLIVPYLVAEASAAEDVSAAVTWNTITLTLDPHGDIDFGEVIPSVRDTSIGNYGTQKVVKKAIDVTTEGNYFAVYLSTIDDDNSLATSGDTVQNIPAIGSNVASGFNSTSWGYAIPTQATATTFSAYDSYLATTSDLTANNLTKRGVGSAVYNTGSWSAVPVLENTLQVYSNSTEAATGFSSGDSFNIYYSIMVDTDTMSGTYENQIVYTALASSQSLDTASQNVSRDKDIVADNTVETLQIDLASNLDFATNDVKVYLVPHAVVVTENYSLDNLTATNYHTCTVSSVTSQGLSATITCVTPGFATTSLSGDTIEPDSEYDFWIQVTAPTGDILNYLSHYRATDEDTGITSDIASVTYKPGLQSTDANGDYYITTMQSVTGTVCELTPSYSESNETYSLVDTRDNNSYDVRKIGSDCWMISNLRFTGTNLDSETSDVDTSKSISWNDFSEGGEREEFAYIHDSGNSSNGAWYNLYGASGGTIENGEKLATHSICPKNWKLPLRSQDFASLTASYTGFSPIKSGIWVNGNNKYTDYGFWMLGTVSYDTFGNASGNSFFWSDDSELSIYPSLSPLWGKVDTFSKRGFSVRCVARD